MSGLNAETAKRLQGLRDLIHSGRETLSKRFETAFVETGKSAALQALVPEGIAKFPMAVVDDLTSHTFNPGQDISKKKILG